MTKFYMGRPCKHGHDGRRYESGGCVECTIAKASKRSKTAEWKKYKAEYSSRPETKLRRSEYMTEYNAKPENKRLASERRAKPENKRRRAERDRLRVYDLTPTEYNFMFAGQQFRCELCGADEPGGKHGWQTDHCHETDWVRGILCFNCNTSLGKLGDTPEALLRAHLYTKGEFSWTNLMTPTAVMVGPSKPSPPTAPNESKQAGWSAGIL